MWSKHLLIKPQRLRKQGRKGGQFPVGLNQNDLLMENKSRIILLFPLLFVLLTIHAMWLYWMN